MRSFRSYLFFICLFTSVKLFCQSYNFKNYTVEHGLTYIHIQDIFQDDKGYLWTGGYGGLSKFDGLKFTNYTPRDGLRHYSVQSITQDAEKNMVVGTIEGLSVFNGKKFTNYSKKEGLLNEHINTLALFGKKIAIGTDQGLFYLAGHKISEVKNLRGETIKKIKTSGKTLTGVTQNKIFSIGEKLFLVPFSFMPGSDTLITCFEYDKEGVLWLGTNKGLFKMLPLPDGKGAKMKLEPLIENTEITCIYSDKKNSLWIGTHEKLLNYTGKLKHYALSKEYNANDILSITSDYEQNIWIGTHSGIFKFRDEGFVCYDFEDGLKSTMIYPIVLDKQNNIWFGTERGGMYKFDGTTFTNFSTHNGLPGITVRGLAFDSLDRLWISTEKGLCMRENNTYKKVSGLQDIFIQSLYLDKWQRLWVGLTNGVAYLENIYGGEMKLTKMKLPTDIKSADHFITSFCGDDKGNVWAASFISGIYLYDNKEFRNVTKEYKIGTHSVSDVVVTKDNTLYIGTLDGIYVVNPQTVLHEKITVEDGLNSDLVYSVYLTDDEKTLWAGTNQGANKINLQNYFSNRQGKILSFGKTEGFKGVECNTGGLRKDANGILWFGTVNGVVKHTPGIYTENKQESKLSFTNFKLFYDDTLLEQNTVLPASLNNITFQYAGICLTNPDKVRYVHRLEGFDKSWSPETNQNFVTYSNLPAGKYTFRVRCCNNQGLWNSTPLSFSFTVTPPIWQRWWFIGCELAMMGALIFTIFRVRLNQLRKEQRREARTQIEISKNELKALRAQMNPHFLFNSLNSIQQFILNNKDEEAVFYLNRFARLMRMILNNSEKQSVTLSEEINALRIYIELEKMRFAGKFDFEIIVEPGVDPDYEQIPTMLVQPYVENAILHGLVPNDKKGKLLVRFFIKNGFLHAIIEDSGIGRKKSAEMNRDSRKSHVSMGMKITRDRLKLLGDVQQTTYHSQVTDLVNDSGEAIGTRVEITWPVL